MFELKGKMVDVNTVEIDGVDTKDYPDFCDTYIECAQFTDGTELTDVELEEFSDNNPELINEMAFESLL
jgi:hypothetical protein